MTCSRSAGCPSILLSSLNSPAWSPILVAWPGLEWTDVAPTHLATMSLHPEDRPHLLHCAGFSSGGFVFSMLDVGGVAGQEKTKTNCHQCQSDTPDATSAARMSGEVNLNLCKGGQIPHSTKQGRKARSTPSVHHSNRFFRKALHALLSACCSPITTLSSLLQPFHDGRGVQNTLQQWTK